MIQSQRQLYFDQQDTVETLYAFHPELFEHLSQEELTLLDDYYFMRRAIDVEDIADYAAQLLRIDPTIRERAEAVLLTLLRAFRFSEQSIRELLSIRQAHVIG